jgi:hypothetical protein
VALPRQLLRRRERAEQRFFYRYKWRSEYKKRETRGKGTYFGLDFLFFLPSPPPAPTDGISSSLTVFPLFAFEPVWVLFFFVVVLVAGAVAF